MLWSKWEKNSCIVFRDCLIKVLLQIYSLQTQGFRYISFCDDLTQNRKKKFTAFIIIYTVLDYITDRIEILFWVCIQKKKNLWLTVLNVYCLKQVLIGLYSSNLVHLWLNILGIVRHIHIKIDPLDWTLWYKAWWDKKWNIEISMEAFQKRDTDT